MNNIFIIIFMIDIKPRWSLKDFESNFYNIIIIFNALINYYQVVKTSMSPSYYDHKMTIFCYYSLFMWAFSNSNNTIYVIGYRRDIIFTCILKKNIVKKTYFTMDILPFSNAL